MICAVETWKYIYSLILVLNLGGKSLPNLIKQSFSYLTCFALNQERLRTRIT